MNVTIPSYYTPVIFSDFNTETQKDEISQAYIGLDCIVKYSVLDGQHNIQEWYDIINQDHKSIAFVKKEQVYVY